eukprot:gb/GEZN01015324.1/.p1 GENE.gb/GEZN01015324.1/~~gb/GEZN01015324.1/.p1  ORF type:complete len:195 (+),score=32.66 gb/GEZN01015324.1/:95-679(+)
MSEVGYSDLGSPSWKSGGQQEGTADFSTDSTPGVSLFRKLAFTAPPVTLSDKQEIMPAASNSFYDELSKGSLMDTVTSRDLPKLEDMLVDIESTSCRLSEQFAQLLLTTKGQTKDVTNQTLFLMGLMREGAKVYTNGVQEAMVSTSQLVSACTELDRECEKLEGLKAQLNATKQQLTILDKHIKKHCGPKSIRY